MKQFGRVIQLNIGNATESMIYNNLRITFNITKTITSEPNTSEISIYNLNQNSRNLITSKVYDHVELFVSYQEDDLRMIFKGDIIEVINTQSGLDIITKLKCSDGYFAYTEKIIVKTIAAGQTDADVLHKEVISSFSIQQGAIDLPYDQALPRARVFMCDTRDVANRIAQNNNADWSIQDHQLIIIPKNKAIQNDDGFIISSTTGMIGSPKKTSKGLEITTLCNPHFKIGSLVKVESKSEEYNGHYKVKSIQHSGDLTGNEWKSKLICVAGEFSLINQ